MKDITKIARHMFATKLLVFAIAFLSLGLMAGGFACITAAAFIDLISSKEASLLFLFTQSSAAASFLFSVLASFYVAFYVIRRAEKDADRDKTEAQRTTAGSPP